MGAARSAVGRPSADAKYDRLLPREPLHFDLPDLTGKFILVTGSAGFLGTRVSVLIEKLGGKVQGMDLPLDDVRRRDHVQTILPAELPPDAVIHLAAHKYATTAEEHPAEVAELNIAGTQNVVELGVPVVLASTCKAVDPCTVYGASKLIAERIVLNAGGTVCRFVNVLGSTGSVLRIWERSGGVFQVAPGLRMWMSPREAAEFIVAATAWEPGRYAPEVGVPEKVRDLFDRVHGSGRPPLEMHRRRGDRFRERLVGENEQIVSAPEPRGAFRIFDSWGT